MTRLWKPLLGLALALAGTFPAAPAQEDAAREAAARRIWASLSRDRRERIVENYRRFLAMPPAQRSRLEERYEAFRRLTPDRRARILEKWERFKALSPRERRALLRPTTPARPSGRPRRAAPAPRRREPREPRTHEPHFPIDRGPREHGGPSHRR